MQFQVPQFLDVEDKVIGPFTIKQFLYLAGGLGLGYLSFRFIPYLGAILGLGFAGFGAALAFYKYNNKPFAFLLESGWNYIRGDRFYVWKRKEAEEKARALPSLDNFRAVKHGKGPAMQTVSNRLSDLSWSMNVPKDEAVDRTNEIGL